MKKIYLFAAMATMLAACSENDLTVEKQAVQQNAEEAAVQFDVYTSRGTTRAGNPGVLTTSNTTAPNIALDAGSTIGFGVFGYYTDGEPYSGITKPNFFYNQKVYYNSTRWYYTPVRYWPNEFGGDAISDQVDYVTLFAYAPYVPVNVLTGVADGDAINNIIGMSRNNVTGDPFVKYNASLDPANAVDLCYGVAAEQFTSTSSSVSHNNIAKGKPYINIVKPGTDTNSKIKFDFKHALAQLNVTIDANVNDKTNLSGNIQTEYSRIWVRSVTFTGVTLKGSLNLNSTDDSPEWYDINGNNKITSGSLTVFDGRKDAKEAIDEAPSEIPATLNENIVQASGYTLNPSTGVITDPTELGVTSTTLNLFNSTTATDPIFVIPTNEAMRVTIVYDVETVDPNLPYYLSDGKTQGVTVQNTIYKDIATFDRIKAGQKYVLHLHLGMRTVDFDAEVTPWEDNTADVDLPANMPTFTLGNSPSITLGSAASSYQFAIKGFNASETISSAVGDGTVVATALTSSPATANGSGIFIGVAAINKNDKISDRNGTITVTGGTHTTPTTINVKQLAHELGLSATTPSAGASPTITLSSSADGITATDWSSATITIKKGNTVQNPGTGTNTYTISDATSPVITFNDPASSGDVYTITVNPGPDKAPAETVTVVVQ